MTFVNRALVKKVWNSEPSSSLSGGHSATKQVEYLRTLWYAWA
jgi:hypothetical protein